MDSSFFSIIKEYLPFPRSPYISLCYYLKVYCFTICLLSKSMWSSFMDILWGRIKIYVSLYGYPTNALLFILKNYFFSDYKGRFFINQVIIHVWVHILALCSVPLVFSPLIRMSHWLNYCSFTANYTELHMCMIYM